MQHITNSRSSLEINERYNIPIFLKINYYECLQTPLGHHIHSPLINIKHAKNPSVFFSSTNELLILFHPTIIDQLYEIFSPIQCGPKLALQLQYCVCRHDYFLTWKYRVHHVQMQYMNFNKLEESMSKCPNLHCMGGYITSPSSSNTLG